VEYAFVSDSVDNGLHLAEQFGGFGFVASQNSFFDVLDRSTVLRTQRGVSGVDFFVLTDAFAARRKARVFFFGLADAMFCFP